MNRLKSAWGNTLQFAVQKTYRFTDAIVDSADRSIQRSDASDGLGGMFFHGATATGKMVAATPTWVLSILLGAAAEGTGVKIDRASLAKPEPPGRN